MKIAKKKMNSSDSLIIKILENFERRKDL